MAKWIWLLFFHVIIAEPYERFVSLGNCCVTRIQINHHLSQRFDRPASSFGGGQLFDWLIIHDYRLFSQALENELTDLFELPDLVVDKLVKNVKYKMTWNHLFSKNEKGVCPDNILELEYPLKKQKIDYLIEKFKDLRRYRTLYILAFPFDETQKNVTEPTPEVLARLIQALEKLRGNDNFTLLYCPLKERFEAFEKLCIRQMDNPINGKSPSEGDYEKWDRMLLEFPFTLEKAVEDNSCMDNTKVVPLPYI